MATIEISQERKTWCLNADHEGAHTDGYEEQVSNTLYTPCRETSMHLVVGRLAEVGR